MKIFITGGAGFIGSYLAEHHVKKGDEVRVLDDLSHGSLKNLSSIFNHSQFQWIEGDILTSPALQDCVKWSERIYHLASAVGMFYLIQHPLITMRTNLLGCERLLDYISRTQSKTRLLIASSSEVYGPDTPCPLKETQRLAFESRPSGKWFYAASKYASEMLSLAYVKDKNLKVTIVRLFNTIGPRQNPQYGSVVPRFIEQAMRGEPITIFGTGEQTRCFGDVRDIVTALDLALDNPKTIGKLINVGQNKAITINELAKIIKKLTKSTSKFVYIPYEEAYEAAYEDILHRQPDLDQYFRLIPYRFQWNLENSLRHQIEAALCLKFGDFQ